jgi:hypothetical protein
MKPLTADDLMPPEEYERVRESFRRSIIELKRRRRIAVGDHITLLFENRDTVRFQVQEMIRTEHIVDPQKIQEELDVYNAQLPGDGELSATLFIEITDNERIQPVLDALRGLDHGNTVSIKVGPHTVYAEFESGRSNETKLSAVHFLKFRPPPALVRALTDGSPVSVRIDHPAYRKEAAVPQELRDEWLNDLQPAETASGRPVKTD